VLRPRARDLDEYASKPDPLWQERTRCPDSVRIAVEQLGERLDWWLVVAPLITDLDVQLEGKKHCIARPITVLHALQA
jgi:hypothetical protein